MVRVNNIIALVVFLIILCAVLAVVLLYQNNVDIIKKTRYYPTKTIIFDHNSFQDDRLVYLVCEPARLSKCKLVQEKYPFKEVYRSCRVELEVDGTHSDSTMFAVAMGFDRTILVWDDHKQKPGDGPFARFKIVDFEDKCKHMSNYKEYHPLNVVDFQNTTKIVPYISKFEVFYKNYNECHLTECELTLDVEGDIINPGNQQNITMNNIESDVKYIFPVKNYAPDKGLVYVKYRKNIKSSDIYYSQFADKPERSPIIILPGEAKISVVNESIVVCSRANYNSKLSTNITCHQLYIDTSVVNHYTAKFKLNVTIEDVNNITHLHDVYSLPEGGFLVSFIDYGRCQEDVCDSNLMSNYFIMRIDANGNQVGKLRFQGLDKELQGLKHAHIYKQQKKNSEEYCVVIVPMQKQEDKFDILANCFPLSNFVS